MFKINENKILIFLLGLNLSQFLISCSNRENLYETFKDQRVSHVGNFGTCSIYSMGFSSCSEFNYSGTTTWDDLESEKTKFLAICNDHAGTFNESAVCNRSLALGYCTYPSFKRLSGLTISQVTIYPGLSVPNCETICTRFNGIFTPIFQNQHEPNHQEPPRQPEQNRDDRRQTVKTNICNAVGLDPNHATHQAIRTAYRRRARELHPDRNPSPNATAEFQTLSAIYEAYTELYGTNADEQN